MPDVTMRAGEVLEAERTVKHLLVLHSPLPADVDKGASKRAGIKLRGIRRILSQKAEDIQEEIEEARTAALREREAEQAFRAAIKAIASTPVVLSVPELLTSVDWDAIPMQAPGFATVNGADGQPSSVPTTLRKTEADLDALGPLVSDPDNVG